MTFKKLANEGMQEITMCHITMSYIEINITKQKWHSAPLQRTDTDCSLPIEMLKF